MPKGTLGILGTDGQVEQDTRAVIQAYKTTKFVVKNIALDYKTINIFTYPIVSGQTRDLLSIPFISESDIRFHLLKGEILLKLLAKEIIIVESNIDLLQFDSAHKQFLKDSGVVIGTEVGVDQITNNLYQTILDGYGGGGSSGFVAYVDFHENIPLIGTKNGINTIFITPNKFIEGTLEGSDFAIRIRYNGRGLDPSFEYSISESGGPGTGYDTIQFLSFIPSSFSSLLADYVSYNTAGGGFGVSPNGSSVIVDNSGFKKIFVFMGA